MYTGVYIHFMSIRYDAYAGLADGSCGVTSHIAQAAIARCATGRVFWDADTDEDVPALCPTYGRKVYAIRRHT